ncbi:MAG TPA: hypothetical protein PKA37_13755 [Planctomycetota bacterium]|nr:hypothetical protein [Planctomycetota bacterium]
MEAPTTEPRQPAASASDAGALEILKKCAELQTPGGTAPEVETFQSELQVTLWEDDQGNRVAKPRSGTIVQYWKRQGELTQYHRQLEITGSEANTSLISDGRGFWLQKSKEPARNLVIDANLSKDLENLKGEIRRTSELMRSFFVANLITADTKFTLLHSQDLLNLPNERREVKVFNILRECPKEEPMVLTIGTEDYRLYQVDLGPRNDGPSRETFRFEHHQTVTDGGGRELLVPCVVQFFRGGQEILVARADRPHKIQFNTKILAKVFRPRP